MPRIARIEITNVYMGGDYTGRILVGPHQRPMNVILDTGSSALALDGHKYAPDLTAGDEATTLAQTDAYGDGSTWTGAVLKTQVTIGVAPASVTLGDANVAVAYARSSNMFRQADGILGLAYAALDDAFDMPENTWNRRYSASEVRTGHRTDLVPYLTQLQQEGVTSDIISFFTRRSFTRAGPNVQADPLNQGWMIVGGGEEATDLYTGPFQNVRVLSDDWYSTNLRAIRVGNAAPIGARRQGPQGMPSNSIIDSGTNSLNLGQQLLDAVIAQFTPHQQALLNRSIAGQLVSADQLDLATWPTITFLLEGSSGDVSVDVPPENYWQLDTEQPGAAMIAITKGQDGFAILGLPLMNGYFTIFDGEADSGRGVVRFAQRTP